MALVMRRLWLGMLLLTTVLVTPGCQRDGARDAGSRSLPPAEAAGDPRRVAQQPLTFNRHIAPIIFARCAPCHRPGEAGPFSLLSYADVAKRADQIVEVTANRYMPPWLPAEGDHALRGRRRLSPEELESIAAWVRAGAPEGDPKDLSPQPKWTDGWQLGEPDLVLPMRASYELRAAGADVIRNFIIPVRIPERRYVRAFEFRPGNARVVHHADIRVDVAQGSRELDALDEEPGFDGVFGGDFPVPGGVFLGWTPGRVPFPGDPRIAWPLENGMDLVLQLHLQPTGKQETIRSSVGIYYADEPPTQIPFAMSIGCKFFDIAPGDKNYTVTRSYQLPVDALLVSIYPHAHYLAKRVRGAAKLPDGTETTLIDIREWDFNWQDQYWYEEPIRLPKGTTVTMHFVYDNSADNVRNPHHPPQRVVYGPNSTNEMGELMLQLVLNRAEDLAAITTDLERYQTEQAVADLQKSLRRDPENPDAFHVLGLWYVAMGEFEKATELFENEIRYRAKDAKMAKAHHLLAFAYEKRGMAEHAARSLRHALAIEPGLTRSRVALGNLLVHQGKPAEALPHYQRALERDPERVDLLTKVAELSAQLGQLAQTAAACEKILQLQPDNVRAHFNLGNVLLAQRQWKQAAEHFDETLRLRPDFVEAHKQRGVLYAIQENYAQAAQHLEKALALRNDFVEAHRDLARVRQQQGRDAEAVRHYRRALAAPRPSLTTRLNLAWLLATSPDDQVRQPGEAVKLAEQCAEATRGRNAQVLDKLAVAYASAGQYERATATAQQALRLARSSGRSQLADQIQTRLALFQQGKPYRPSRKSGD